VFKKICDITAKQTLGPVMSWVRLSWLCAICLIAETGEADTHAIGVGVGGGLSTVTRVSDNPPDTVNGGMVNASASYAFNDEFGVRLDGALQIQSPYYILVRGLVPVDETVPEKKGETVIDWIKGPHINRSLVSSVTLSGVYFIEILTVRPYVVAGIAGLRSDLYYDGGQQSGYALAFRIGLGADYLMMDRLGVGIVAQSDIFVIGASSYFTRMALAGLVTYYFGPSNL